MTAEQQRHDINDKAWEKIRPHTIGEKGTRGGNARDTRQFINGVFWILRTGAPWRDLPETYGNWKNVHRRFCRWRDKCALPGFVDSKNEEKTERNAGYLVVSQSGGGMLRQGTREGIRRTPANRGMRAHRIVKGLDISEDVCHGMCP